MVRKSSLFAKASKGINNSQVYETSYGSRASCGTISGSDGSEFRERGGSQSSETSTNSSGENARYINISASAEDLRSNDSLKRHGLLSPFSDLDGNTSELDFYYGIVKRHILRHQSVMNGLFPSHSSETNVGSIRDTIYSCMACWSLHLAYRKHDDNHGKAYELGQAAVMGMQGILYCWMRQSNHLEIFKHKQGAKEPLHSIFDMDTSAAVKSTDHYNHLQIDVVSLYIMFLVQCISSGLEIISTIDEVNFVQNLVYYVERSYRIPDFGMWERGSTANNGTCELNASSIGMAKAALEAIGGFNLFGKGHGSAWSKIMVDTDAHNRNREILETMIPRESPSRRIDFATFISISFPAFSLSNGTEHLAHKLYNKTKKDILTHLSSAGDYGFKRFKGDGYGNALETTVDGRFYHEGKTLEFDGIENEWPMFYLYMVIDGVFLGDDSQVDKYQKLLQRRLCYAENGDPLVPKYYSVPYQNILAERESPGSQGRVVSKEGSSEFNVYLWGQSLLIIAELLTTQNIQAEDLDILGRIKSPGDGSLYQRASSVPRTIGLKEKGEQKESTREESPKFSTNELNLKDLVDDVWTESGQNASVVQVVIISESRQLQATLNTFGIQTQTPSEVEPIQIWSQWEMVKILQKLGQNQKLGLTGRPPRPIGVLGTCKLYRVSGRTVLCYPLTFSATDFYLGHDLALLTANIKSDLRFVSQRWNQEGQYGTCASPNRTRSSLVNDISRPTYCIVITENNLHDPQFPELLSLLCELRNLNVDGVKIRHGRLQNIMATAVVENLDFTCVDRFGIECDDNENSKSPNIGKNECADKDLTDDLKKIEDSNLKRGGRFQQVVHEYLGFGGHIRMDIPRSISTPQEDEKDYVTEYLDKPTHVITHDIMEGRLSNNLFGKIQLLGILLHRHGPDFIISKHTSTSINKSSLPVSVKGHLEHLNRLAGTKRQWMAVRYSAALLRQMVDSISPFVAHILVNRKQVTVGTIGGDYALFSRQPGPTEVEEALYTKVYSFPDQVIPAVLQQELILYCGKLIATNPELFSGILKVRMSWLLRAMSFYHEMTRDTHSNTEASMESLPPSKIMRLLYEVLSASRKIQFNYDDSSSNSPSYEKSKQSTRIASQDDHILLRQQSSNRSRAKSSFTTETPAYEARIQKLTVFQTRQINGCLIRAPTTFYTDIWHVLSKCPAGIRIKGKLLPQQPTILIMSSFDEAFAHLVEDMLNLIRDSVEKQMAVETFCVICTIMKRHPELRLGKQEELDIGKIIDDAVQLYWKHRDSNTKRDSHNNVAPETPIEQKELAFDDSSFNSARRKFFNESVSTTSIFVAKVTINSILNNVSLAEALESAASSKYQCPVQ